MVPLRSGQAAANDKKVADMPSGAPGAETHTSSLAVAIAALTGAHSIAETMWSVCYY